MASWDRVEESAPRTQSRLDAKKEPVETRAVIPTGIVIGGADGGFDRNGQAVVREACFALGPPPHEVDLCATGRTAPGRVRSGLLREHGPRRNRWTADRSHQHIYEEPRTCPPDRRTPGAQSPTTPSRNG